MVSCQGRSSNLLPAHCPLVWHRHCMKSTALSALALSYFESFAMNPVGVYFLLLAMRFLPKRLKPLSGAIPQLFSKAMPRVIHAG